jgi:hypothetical protein
VAITSPNHSSRYRIRFQRDRIAGVSTTKFECLTASAVMMNNLLAYQPCPGLLTGGKLFRNSFCWRSASFCWSASRACCSGLGPEPAQPSNWIANVEIKTDLVSSFFIREVNRTIISAINAATTGQMFREAAKPDHSTFVTSYSPTAWSRSLCSSTFRCSRISFNASSFFKLT